MEKITLTTNLSLDDYIKVNYHMLYRKLWTKLMLGIGILMLISILISFLFDPTMEFPVFQLIFGLFITIGLPIQVYFAAKRNYKLNTRLRETIIYELSPDTYRITGESFHSESTWDKVHGVTESKDWVLIWPTRHMANVIPKRTFMNNDLPLFKELLGMRPELKGKLKFMVRK